MPFSLALSRRPPHHFLLEKVTGPQRVALAKSFPYLLVTQALPPKQIMLESKLDLLALIKNYILNYKKSSILGYKSKILKVYSQFENTIKYLN